MCLNIFVVGRLKGIANIELAWAEKHFPKVIIYHFHLEIFANARNVKSKLFVKQKLFKPFSHVISLGSLFSHNKRTIDKVLQMKISFIIYDRKFNGTRMFSHIFHFNEVKKQQVLRKCRSIILLDTIKCWPFNLRKSSFRMWNRMRDLKQIPRLTLLISQQYFTLANLIK